VAVTNTVVLLEELEQLRHELANAKTHITLQESINHLLEQHIASQDTVIQAARALMAPGFKFGSHYRAIADAISALDKADHASS
jgi:septal ring factor EnvC (AmiA/AmiB activator)